ncbi:MAG: hypothetical protein LKF61_02335 [Eggerthellaceae bacterium]|nr:hypothetical protein [Eggerthellaceae bacterium]
MKRICQKSQIFVMTLCALVLCSAALPQMAWAYYDLPPVEIYLSTGSISMVSGSHSTIGCGLSMVSEEQTVGCGMAECPQACGGLTTPQGVRGGCADENGWCTCLGGEYSTYYTIVSIYSDNPGVARGSYNGSGALDIATYGAGSATLTVRASLRQHRDSVSYVQVDVSDDGSADSSNNQGGVSPRGGTTNVGGGTNAQSGGLGGDAGSSNSDYAASVIASATGVPSAVPLSEATDERNVTVIETIDGRKMLVVQANAAVNCADELAQIAGTDGSCTFWVGANSDKPDISWSFIGTDLDPDGNLDMDLGVTVSAKGTGRVADVLSHVQNAIVIEWEHTGALPGKANVHVRTVTAYADGTSLSLYRFNEDLGRFELIKTGIVTENGYASFDIDHCSTWALSTDDLAKYPLAVTQTRDDVSSSAAGNAEDAHNTSSEGVPAKLPIAPIVTVAIIAVAAIAFVVWYFVRNKNSRQSKEPSEQE